MVKRILALFTREIRGLHEAAYLLAIFTFLSQILALVRDKLLAFSFGAGHTLDLYYAAFRIPDILFASLASMVAASILVPFFMQKQSEGKEQGKKIIDSTFSLFSIVMVGVSIIVYIFVPKLIPLTLPGLADPGTFDHLVSLTRILLLQPIFFGFSNFFSSITQMQNRFLLYAMSPVLYNLGIILGIAVLYPYFGLDGLAYGVVIGALLHCLVHVPYVIKHGLFPKFSFTIDWKAVKGIVRTALPRTITLSAHQISTFFLIAFASGMTAGSISIFTFALNLQSLPLAVVGASYSSAVFPALAKFFSEKNIEKFVSHVATTVKHIIFWSIPISAICIVLRAQIVRTILGAGKFDWSDTRLTAAALALFIISAVGQGLMLIFVRAYYAEGKTSRPLIMNIISALLIIVLAFALIKLYETSIVWRYFIENLMRIGENGAVLMLPLAYTIGVLFNTFLHWIAFEKDYKGFTANIWRSGVHSLGASIIAAYVAYGMLRPFAEIFGTRTIAGIFLQGLSAGVCGIIVGILVLSALKNEELMEIWRTLHAKVWKANVGPSDQLPT
ncbi:MAG: murein biosynthesis integral membrane protein MurJ [Patescibacteria group bacterium]